MSKKEVERVWKVRRWHFIVSLRSKSLRFRVRTALCLVLSLAAIKDANTAVKQCANLSSQAAAKPRGMYVKFTPENQAAIAKYASIVNDARSMVLGSLPNSHCIQQNIRRVKLGVVLKWPARTCPGNFENLNFEILF